MTLKQGHIDPIIGPKEDTPIEILYTLVSLLVSSMFMIYRGKIIDLFFVYLFPGYPRVVGINWEIQISKISEICLARKLIPAKISKKLPTAKIFPAKINEN